MRRQGVHSWALATTAGPAVLYTGEKGVRPPAVVGHRMLWGVSVAMPLCEPLLRAAVFARDPAVELDVLTRCRRVRRALRSEKCTVPKCNETS